MTADRIGIIGSRTYPSKSDVIAFVTALPTGTVVISGGAHGPDTWAVDAAKDRGLTTVIHWPDLPRYGSPSAYYHRNVKIVEDSDRIVAFAALSSKTRSITSGTAMTIGIAERSQTPVEIIQTPVPAAICEAIFKLRNRFDNVKSGATPGERQARIKSATEHLNPLLAARNKYEKRLGDGWEEIDRITDESEGERLTNIWLQWNQVYRVLVDVINEAEHVFSA